ncbi:MAG: glycosyltransferase family 2 protein [Colwellia sp.]|jgi:Glycosyltransferases, probably involved in cell wall biogenesis
MQYLFWVPLFLLMYIYFLYPLIVSILSKKGAEIGDKPNAIDEVPTITIVVPAHNEERVLEEKILNHLKIKYDNSKFIIHILCDSCTDGTVDIADKYTKLYPGMVAYTAVLGGLGKTNAINTLMPKLTSDLIVFSDANVMLEENCLNHIVDTLSDSKVGGVAGQLTYVNESIGGAAESNGLYWRYEEYLKEKESDTGSLMGADGSIFAIKRELYRELPIHVLDDFSTSMGVIAQGFKLKFNTNIKAYEKGAEKNSEEYSRKIRISNRSYNSYRFMKAELKSKLGLFDLWKFYSHKVLRWYSFVFMMVLMCASIYLAFTSIFYSAMLAGQGLFYFLIFLHWKNIIPGSSKIFKISNICYYFFMVNYAAWIGVFQSLTGVKTIVWKKAETTR